MDNNGVLQSRSRPGKANKSKKRTIYNIRLVKNFRSLFVLLLALLVFSYEQGILNNLGSLVGRELTTKVPPWVKSLYLAIFTDCIPKLLYPFAGWLADAKLGRYKVIRYSLFIMWIGSLIQVLTSLVRYVFILVPIIHNENIIKFTLPLLVLSYVINAVGIAGYHANLIPFGIDQMEDCSGEQISSFIHWYYWTRNFNFGTIIKCILHTLPSYCDDNGMESHQRFHLISFLVQMVFLTAAVSLDFLFSSKLKRDPKLQNPIKKVKAVSIFILKHDQPVGRRKAHTYTYDTPPSRSDFAKESYGGPFDDDEVEEVTAFWRIVTFLFTIGFGVFTVQTGTYIFPTVIEHMNHESFSSYCSSKYVITELVSVATFTLSIPIFEFLIYPFFRKYIPRMTVRIGIGMVVMMLGFIALLVVDAVGHSETGHSSICMFYQDNHTIEHSIKARPFLLVFVIVIISIGEMFVFISTLEYICAQAPYSMQGLMIGIFYCIYGIFIALMGVVLVAFSLGFREYQYISNSSGKLQLSCGTWYMITIILISGFGTVLYILVSKWYKKRQRGGQTNINYQTILENYYES